MEHSFDIEVAKEIGVYGAVILKHIYFWVRKNELNNKHFADGSYWTYNSIKAFGELFPYMTEKQIRNTLTNLEKDGYIVTGNYNNSSYDRTKWYAISQKGKSILLKGQMEITKKENGNYQKGEPIPDIITDNKNTDRKTDIENVDFEKIISYLNEKADTSYRPSSKETQKYILARYRDGYCLEDFFKVIDAKVLEWKNDSKMSQYLRPSTLFGTKFESYLQQYKEPVTKKTDESKLARNDDGSLVTY